MSSALAPQVLGSAPQVLSRRVSHLTTNVAAIPRPTSSAAQAATKVQRPRHSVPDQTGKDLSQAPPFTLADVKKLHPQTTSGIKSPGNPLHI
ncbi:hypothetical protein WJX84_004149 [Apatococcus fuscideae]|uniref:Uncharacterized protein n=1 Tax=Apatococcus fuscideae TaxID=2026836 RepID=A0AAW1THN3_9CHLO